NEIMSIDKVLMVKDGEKLQIGHPYVKGAEVKARIVGHARGKKIVVLKYKSKSNYRRKIGHRQHFTSVLIEDIKC
ncbi:MAG: 50S ribosomal protein L21, partial [Candidatus Riflebacteria bacterium GWC2_50_8]